MSTLRSGTAIDLGASTLRVRRGAGSPVASMPARVVLEDQDTIFAMGEDAVAMEGRTWGALKLCRPTSGGTVADQRVTQIMVRTLMRESGRARLTYGGRVGVCVSPAVTDLGAAALRQLCRDVGFSDVRLVPQALAAAVGAGIAVNTPYASVLVDLGAEHTSAALVVYGRVIASRSTRMGGDALDALLLRHLREEHQVVIGAAAAQTVKTTLRGARETVSVRGQDAVTARPRGLMLPLGELHEVLLPRAVAAVCDQVTAVLAGCPVEMAADVYERGIVLTGGGARLHGLVEAVRAESDLPVHVVEDCELIAVKGTQMLMDAGWAGVDRSALRAAALAAGELEPEPVAS
ncbi:rod shape-determining protein [Streptacidiphilus sp. EB103A]|uniref:rod shape-determining protein n=1 Tax=Streptacidiphilus sp. EB103A TaxID=3156275 RepID=UPI00351567BC